MDEKRLSKREELGPLVRDFHESINRDVTDEELQALDFALEWSLSYAEGALLTEMKEEYAVTYGMFPQIRLIQLPSLDIAKGVARGLNGQVVVRHNTKWIKYLGD